MYSILHKLSSEFPLKMRYSCMYVFFFAIAILTIQTRYYKTETKQNKSYIFITIINVRIFKKIKWRKFFFSILLFIFIYSKFVFTFLIVVLKFYSIRVYLSLVLSLSYMFWRQNMVIHNFIAIEGKKTATTPHLHTYWEKERKESMEEWKEQSSKQP